MIPEGTYGTFTFNGSMTRSSIGYADFLLGIPQIVHAAGSAYQPHANQQGVGTFYFTDTFKVSSRLTLDYGVRYDYYALPTFTDDLMFNWDRATNTVNVTPEGRNRIHPLYPKNIQIGTGPVVPVPDKKNIRPRLSAAYRLSDKLVFRGGYGAYTERIDYFQRVLTGGPFQISESYQNVIAPGGGALFQFPNPFPASLASAAIPSQSITGYPIQTDNGTIHQFNFSIEREWQDHRVPHFLRRIARRRAELQHRHQQAAAQPDSLRAIAPAVSGICRSDGSAVGRRNQVRLLPNPGAKEDGRLHVQRALDACQ